MELVNSISLRSQKLKVGDTIIVEYSYRKCYARVLLIDKESKTALILFNNGEYPEIVYLSTIIEIRTLKIKGESKIKYLKQYYQKKLNK